MMEQWRPVLGFTGLYEVSDWGNVRSLDRLDSRGNRLGGRLLRVHTRARCGHLHLHLAMGGDLFGRYVHRLVLEAFVGARPTGKQCCHEDGDPSNNRLDNLRWDTQSSNMMDRVKHGVMPQGSTHWNSKVSEADIRVIKARLAAGDRQVDIAAAYGLSKPAIHAIKSGRTWKHVAATGA